jgi:hypothetical protein
MFLGNYYSKCLLNEIQNKPYNKTKVLITDIIQKIIVVAIIIIALISCGPIEPDYVDKNGKEYMFTHPCVKSHSESKYEYHYGYNMRSGGFDWHYGLNTETICDSSVIDTTEINKDKKFYAKK